MFFILSISFLVSCQKKVDEPIVHVEDTLTEKDNLKSTQLQEINKNTIYEQVFSGNKMVMISFKDK